jgi:hypothetical protein
VLSNKELKLTKPSRDGASQLNSVFDGRAEGARATSAWALLLMNGQSAIANPDGT